MVKAAEKHRCSGGIWKLILCLNILNFKCLFIRHPGGDVE